MTGWVPSGRPCSLRSFEPLVIPGLLQTEDYARAVLRTRVKVTDEEIDEMVTARMDRQSILAQDKPPMLWSIVDEGVLRRPVGGAATMGGQLVAPGRDGTAASYRRPGDSGWCRCA